MVSVKRFVSDNPLLIKALQKFFLEYSKVSDPILSVSCKAKTLNGKIAWTILGSVLFQSCTYLQINKILNKLFECFSEEKLWSLPVPCEKEINEVVFSALEGIHWNLYEHVPGIFWSVGLFVRRHLDLKKWILERTIKEIWRDLGEIYFMGKSNPRPKACSTIYRLISKNPYGLNLNFFKDSNFQNQKTSYLPPLPLSMGARRFLAILGPASDEIFSNLSLAEKQKMLNELCYAIDSKNPYFVSYALQFYLEEGVNDFICRECTNKCKKCPLFEFCPYAIQHKLQ